MSPQNKLKNDIFKLLKTYIQQIQTSKKFTPGVTRIRYAGAYYDHEDVIAMVNAILNGWFGLGACGEHLEQALASYIGVPSALLTNSGSSASLLTIATLASPNFSWGLREGDEVITPACTFPTTINPLIHYRLVPVFLDVDLSTLNTPAALFESALSDKTRAIFVPHTLGNPNDMDFLIRFAKEHNLLLIEDNCDALGSEYDGKKTGSFGLMATESFYPAHHMTTAGEGGAVFINDMRLYKTALSLRDWGRACYCKSTEQNPMGACNNRFGFLVNGHPADHKYMFANIGFNLKPTEIQAAMGLVQLKRFPTFIKKRKENFEYLMKLFASYEEYFTLPRSLSKAIPCWFAFPLTIRDGTPFSRRDITQYLENHMIETRSLFAGNILRHHPYRSVRHRVVGKLTNSDKILKDTFFIGVWPGIDRPQREYIAQVITGFLKKY